MPVFRGCPGEPDLPCHGGTPGMVPAAADTQGSAGHGVKPAGVGRPSIQFEHNILVLTPEIVTQLTDSLLHIIAFENTGII